MSEKSESLSKRQARREEIRRKERQQRTIVLGSIGAIALIVILAIVLPSLRSVSDQAGEFTTVEPVTYTRQDGTRLGDPNAPVKIEIFEDFQCSACKTYADSYEPDVIKNLVETGQAYYIFYEFPFLDDNSASKESDRAALAAECAAVQNKFWDYKKILFANQSGLAGQFSEVRLQAFAESVGLDMTAFNACVASNAGQAVVDEGLALGKQMNVTGTPSVFVNGADVAPGRVPSYQQIYDAVQAAAAQ
jgi:protein-disulfide isomerase